MDFDLGLDLGLDADLRVWRWRLVKYSAVMAMAKAKNEIRSTPLGEVDTVGLGGTVVNLMVATVLGIKDEWSLVTASTTRVWGPYFKFSSV